MKAPSGNSIPCLRRKWNFLRVLLLVNGILRSNYCLFQSILLMTLISLLLWCLNGSLLTFNLVFILFVLRGHLRILDCNLSLTTCNLSQLNWDFQTIWLGLMRYLKTYMVVMRRIGIDILYVSKRQIMRSLFRMPKARFW